MAPDSTLTMVSDFEIMTKAREVKELAIEMEMLRLCRMCEGFVPPELNGPAEQDIRDRLVPPELQAAVESEFHDIITSFERFTGSDSSGRDALMESLTQLRNQMTDPVLSDIDYVGTQLSGWNGPPDGAATVFRKEFLGRLPGYLHNQVGLINELDGALRTANNIAATSQRDLLAIADKTIVALRLTGMGSGGGGDPSDVVLKVLGVAATVVATVVSGGGPAMAFALAGQAANLAVDGVSPNVPAPSGPTPRDVVYSMNSAIDTLVEATQAKDKALAAALRTDLETAESVRDSHLEPVFANIACP